MPLEVADAAGGFSSLTPSGTSVLLEGHLTETPAGTKQVWLLRSAAFPSHDVSILLRLVHSMAQWILSWSVRPKGRLHPLWPQGISPS